MRTLTKKKRTSDAIEILDRRIADDPQIQELVRQERLNARIARLIYQARTRAGLTQAQLARRIPARQLSGEVEFARRRGVQVLMIRPDAAELRLHGLNLMRPDGLYGKLRRLQHAGSIRLQHVIRLLWGYTHGLPVRELQRLRRRVQRIGR